MPDSVKHGDTAKVCRWDLGRDLSAVTQARVLISASETAVAVVDRNGTIETPATGGIVKLQLVAADFNAGKLDAGKTYLVEIETTQPDGKLTHPGTGYERLTVVDDLG